MVQRPGNHNPLERDGKPEIAFDGQILWHSAESERRGIFANLSGRGASMTAISEVKRELLSIIDGGSLDPGGEMRAQ